MIRWIKRLFTRNEQKPLVLTNPIVVPDSEKMPTEVEKEHINEETQTIDYMSMTKPQLLEEAKNRGIPVKSGLKKSEIIAKLI